MNLDQAIRKVHDFPKPGVLFYDITSIFTNPTAFKFVVDKMEDLYKNVAIDGVVAIESRGFLLASPFAIKRSIPLVLARKKGKLPGETIRQSYTLEYGEATLEIHKADLMHGKKWLIIDDLIATGGTLEAVAKMIESQGDEVVGIFSIIGLPFLNYEKKLSKYKPTTLINYHGE
ncbi:MAG TPA: adenine phosphoribosyltransferase [Candidatus Omnitrophota bacterium]|nr:adenine phosphoribosyltransferase [Candidatus Omnitrophota bacterium]HPS19654.1 adenine phosphoribosyltransferase [Candidatus Omnitrophota bacterium]